MKPTSYIADRTTAQWQELDRQHYLHPFTDYKNLHAKGSRVIVKAEGVYLYDSEGNRMLDGMAGLWCVNVGYGRKELAEAAYRQLLELPYYNSFFQTAHPPAIELAKQLVDLTPPQFNRVFFTGSGSEGNDTVVRLDAESGDRIKLAETLPKLLRVRKPSRAVLEETLLRLDQPADAPLRDQIRLALTRTSATPAP